MGNVDASYSCWTCDLASNRVSILRVILIWIWTWTWSESATWTWSESEIWTWSVNVTLISCDDDDHPPLKPAEVEVEELATKPRNRPQAPSRLRGLRCCLKQ